MRVRDRVLASGKWSRVLGSPDLFGSHVVGAQRDHEDGCHCSHRMWLADAGAVSASSSDTRVGGRRAAIDRHRGRIRTRSQGAESAEGRDAADHPSVPTDLVRLRREHRRLWRCAACDLRGPRRDSAFGPPSATPVPGLWLSARQFGGLQRVWSVTQAIPRRSRRLRDRSAGGRTKNLFNPTKPLSAAYCLRIGAAGMAAGAEKRPSRNCLSDFLPLERG